MIRQEKRLRDLETTGDGGLCVTFVAYNGKQEMERARVGDEVYEVHDFDDRATFEAAVSEAENKVGGLVIRVVERFGSAT